MPLLIDAARALLPGSLFQLLRQLRSAAMNAVHARRRAGIARRVLEIYGSRVVQGPFAGMKYLTQATGSEFVPKLLGTYESELRDVIEQVISKRYRTIIDVGCAEGYYAVGLALRCPWTRVVAYDINPEAQKLCHALTLLNGMQRQVEIRGEFRTADLQSGFDQPALVLMDCEGAELELVGRASAAAIESFDWLIETHDFMDSSITNSIVSKLAPTHDLRLLDSRVPEPDRWPTLWFLQSRRDRRLALEEARVPMQWILATKHTSGSKPSAAVQHEVRGLVP